MYRVCSSCSSKTAAVILSCSIPLPCHCKNMYVLYRGEPSCHPRLPCPSTCNYVESLPEFAVSLTFPQPTHTPKNQGAMSPPSHNLSYPPRLFLFLLSPFRKSSHSHSVLRNLEASPSFHYMNSPISISIITDAPPTISLHSA